MRTQTLLFVLLASGVAEAAEPFGRASIDDSGGIVAGQQVYVVVDVFVPDFFVSPPQFPLFEVAGSLVNMSNESASNLLQTIDGVQYAGIRRLYAVVPETTGRFSLPQIKIPVAYREDGKPARREVTVNLPQFDVATSPVDQRRPAFGAVDLKLSQTFDADPSRIKTGGALVRTITIVARDTQAMLIPPFDPGTATGLEQYAKPPILKDDVDLNGRGRGTAPASSRSQVIVYTAVNAGTFDIPAISYPWFDVDSHTVQTATLPAIAVAVEKKDTADDRIRPDVDREETPGRSWSSVATLALTVAVLVGIVGWSLRGAPRFVAAVAKRQIEGVRNSRTSRLRRLRSVIKAGTPRAIYAALQAWSEQLGYRSLSEWVASEGDKRLKTQTRRLNEQLFGGKEARIDRAVLLEAVDTRARKASAPRSVLPPLNPTTNGQSH